MPQVNTLVTDITVAEITPPQPGRTGRMSPARIKDSKGRVWNVWSDKFEAMDIEIGHSYAAMYTVGTYTNPHTGQSRPDNTIVGLNPLGETQPTATELGARAGTLAAAADRTEDIAVQGISHCPEIAAAAAEGDVAKGVKILRTLRLIWREYKKQSVIAPSGGAEFDDEIPY